MTRTALSGTDPPRPCYSSPVRRSAVILVGGIVRAEVTRAGLCKVWKSGLVALLLTTTLLKGQSPPAAEPVTTIHVRTQIVSLDVAVVDKKARPATSTLGREDFSITEDGKPQQLLYFEPLSTHPKPATTVFVLDELNTSFADAPYYLFSLKKYLEALPETLSSPAEVLVLNKTSVQILQPSTRSRTDLLSALTRVPATDMTTLNLTTDEFLLKTLGALESIALGNLGDTVRMNVVWLGPGAGVDTNNQSVTMRARTERFIRYMTNTLLEGRMTLYVVFPPGSPSGSGSRSDRAHEQGVADPYKGSINFRTLAAETGGFVYTGTSDLTDAMGKALHLGNAYYVLTYRPEDTMVDGRFRQIRVTLRNPNLHVITKNGYYAPEAEEQDAPQTNQIFQMTEAGKSTLPFHNLAFRVTHIDRSLDGKTAEFTIFAEGTTLPWRSEGQAESLSELTVGGLSLSRRGEMLSSHFRNVTMMARSQDPLVLGSATASFKLMLPIPGPTDHVRLVVQSVKNGRLGCVDVSQAAINAAPHTAIALPPGT